MLALFHILLISGSRASPLSDGNVNAPVGISISSSNQTCPYSTPAVATHVIMIGV
ncbi:hypothetical protein AA0112_g193 [Alternaria arborescens]|uniref:hypothetical protein n=1 Tax=Alternaria arborescens TaxID=156630 RepID=UPI00107520F3|nr:hypothetical protein AA0111_g1630 [Alternaria arborescens]RYN44251.1 hypothetical protein AA0112_g193 [Alternaria arborescens]RYO39415.1 hypothetical protein AA0111_g1630 [Alternaria arborescens]